MTRAFTWLIREFTACVFIFSGFVKAIDPWGTLYKVHDYLAAMHLSVWPNLVVVGVFFLCGIEFMLGAFLALGCFRKGSAVLTVLFMSIMLPLTLWIALADPVADCGCFGDAWILSNWQTFWKNVVLMACAIWLLRYNNICACIITPALQWLALIFSAAFICVIELIGYLYQPLIDFRPYPVGSTIVESNESTDEDDEPEFIFIYSKDGNEQEFTIDNLPDEEDGWKFIDRKEIDPGVSSSRSGKFDKDKGLAIWENNENVTEDVLSSSDKMLILTMPEMENVSIATVWKINSLYDWAMAHDIGMICVASGSLKDIENWKDISMPEYPIYTSDDTAIKELVRGNPAVIYVENGTIRWKSALRAIDSEDFVTDNPVHDPMAFARDNRGILLWFSYLYILAIGALVMISFIPDIRHTIIRFQNRKKMSIHNNGDRTADNR